MKTKPKDAIEDLDPIAYRKKLAEAKDEAKGILAACAADDNRAMTEEEDARFEELRAAIASNTDMIAKIEAARSRGEDFDEVLSNRNGDPGDSPGTIESRMPQGTPIFESFGAMAIGCADYEFSRGTARAKIFDANIKAAATTYGSEGIGVDGGHLLPEAQMQPFRVLVDEPLSLLSMVDRIPTNMDSVPLPMDTTTPWDTTSGVRCFWQGEGATATQTKPKIQRNRTNLDTLICYIAVTNELLQDAAALGAYLRRKAISKMRFAINRAIIGGDGVGEPLGIINSPCLISVAKVADQVADTVQGQNVIDAYSRMWGEVRGPSAVWLHNQNVEPSLLTMVQGGKLASGSADTGWGFPLYIPPGGIAASPAGMILGHRTLPTEACETVGDVGDLIFAALTEYMMALRTPGPEEAMSIHIYFDQNATAFRFTWRMGGQPHWSAPITGRVGGTTYSPFVAIAARA